MTMILTPYGILRTEKTLDELKALLGKAETHTVDITFLEFSGSKENRANEKAFWEMIKPLRHLYGNLDSREVLLSKSFEKRVLGVLGQHFLPCAGVPAPQENVLQWAAWALYRLTKYNYIAEMEEDIAEMKAAVQ